MDKKKITLLYSRVFVAILFVMFAVVVIKEGAQYANQHWEVNHPIINFFAEKIPSDEVSIRWIEKYPYPTDNEEKTQQAINEEGDSGPYFISQIKERVQSISNTYKNKVDKTKRKIEKSCTDDLFRYPYIAEVAVRLEQMVGWNIYQNVEQSTIDIADGYLIKLYKEKDPTASAERVIALEEKLETKGIEFLYVQAPYKLNLNENNTIDGIYRDYANENATKFIEQVRLAGVDVLDLRESLGVQNMDYREVFFKTDHHWKPEAGLWASNEIANYLNENYQCQIKTSVYDIEKYDVTVYENSFLGSAGRSATLGRAEKEDISLIEPTFETLLKVNIPEYKLNKEGKWIDTLINHSKLNESVGIYKENKYAAYGYGTVSLLETTNKKVEGGKRVLFIKDSFFNVVVPFFCLGVEEFAAIDVRHFTGSLQTYIDEFKPDVVVLAYNPGEMQDWADIEADKTTRKGTWDFR